MGRSSFDYISGLVSVITPVYNSATVIKETIKSVDEQTYCPIEMIIIDDCSTDNTKDIIESYETDNIQLVYFRQSENKGAGAARNKALELAKGQYVAFLDADDTWHKEKISKQIDLLKRTQGAFSYTAIQMIDLDGNIVKEKRNVKETIDYTFLLKNTMIATSTVVIDRCILGDFRMSLRRGGQDYATWLKLLRDGTVAYGINEALGNYRIGNKSSLSSNKFKSIKQVWDIQTHDELIGIIPASLNTINFVLNALKKYML